MSKKEVKKSIDTQSVASTPKPKAEPKSAKKVNKPIESKPSESKQVESKPVESKPVESKQVESKQIESKPVESKPIESKPNESKLVDSKPKKTKSNYCDIFDINDNTTDKDIINHLKKNENLFIEQDEEPFTPTNEMYYADDHRVFLANDSDKISDYVLNDIDSVLDSPDVYDSEQNELSLQLKAKYLEERKNNVK